MSELPGKVHPTDTSVILYCLFLIHGTPYLTLNKHHARPLGVELSSQLYVSSPLSPGLYYILIIAYLTVKS